MDVDFRDHLERSAIKTAPTGVNAHYKMGDVPIGNYLLFAETKIGDNRYQWWKSVSIKAGQAAVVDLDNESITQNPYCVAQ